MLSCCWFFIVLGPFFLRKIEFSHPLYYGYYNMSNISYIYKFKKLYVEFQEDINAIDRLIADGEAAHNKWRHPDPYIGMCLPEYSFVRSTGRVDFM